MKKSLIAVCLTISLCVSFLFGCNSNDVNPNLDLNKEVTLIIGGSQEEYKAMEMVIIEFMKKYPNCHVEYEYLQDYNDSLPKRLVGEDMVDLFFASGIQEDSPFYPYALELYSQGESLDLSTTFDGLIKNFEFTGNESDEPKEIYSIPLGAELRGMYVNVTLLESLGLSVPTNSTEFLAACETLKKAGYTPIQGNPGLAAQQLMYPYICNTIANAENYEEVYARVNAREEGIEELFLEPLSFEYSLVEKGYYNYKYVETEYGAFEEADMGTYSRDFLGIVSDGNGGYIKEDDIGSVAFLPSTLSLSTTLEKVKEDYHSEIEYEFILSPISDEGGFAYMSPANGLAVNRNSENTEWAIEFMNFLFEEENNILFAKAANVIPNTKSAYELIKEEFDIPENQISEVGEVSFDYSFYAAINPTVIAIFKANNPKYMETDENGNTTMYSLDYYMQGLRDAFASVE